MRLKALQDDVARRADTAGLKLSVVDVSRVIECTFDSLVLMTFEEMMHTIGKGLDKANDRLARSDGDK